jgi:signal transduction histidine kinase
MSEPNGFVLLCDSNGNLVEVLHDSLGLQLTEKTGHPFPILAGRGGMEKALFFLAEINEKGTAFDWQVNINWGDQGGTVHVTGSKQGETILIVGAETKQAMQALYAEMASSSDGSTSAMQALIQKSQRDDHLYDEISRLNNEIIAMQRELARKNAELEQRVEERTRELREAQEKLLRQERLAVLGQLAGSVGHELRNPLAVINNAIYFLKFTLPEADKKTKEYLAMIERETRTAEKIIHDLLDFARAKAVERQQISVAALVQNTLERYVVPESILVTLDIPADLPPLWVDARQIEQVLGNLIVNACQAMISSDSSSTSDGSTGGILTLSASFQDNQIKITVGDNGVGIPPENIHRLFEPLFTTKTKGIGLGLAVCKKLVEANEGRIEVVSELGQGSQFHVFLPVV